MSNGSPGDKLKRQEAYAYYKQYIYRKRRFVLLKKYGLPIAGSVPPRDWELFGAILIDALGKSGYGCDLEGCEVKSAKVRGSFEYQYHFRGGEVKLDEDKNADHIFISYTADYKNVTVRRVSGAALADEFESWRKGLRSNYSGKNRKQHYRKSISYNKVLELGTVIISIIDGKLQP